MPVQLIVYTGEAFYYLSEAGRTCKNILISENSYKLIIKSGKR
jgi:hypothetical protein